MISKVCQKLAERPIIICGVVEIYRICQSGVLIIFEACSGGTVMGTVFDHVQRSVVQKTKVQKFAVGRIVKEFQRKHCSLVTMACGSGKSRVTFSVIEKLKKTISIVAVPNLGLIKQVRDGVSDRKLLRNHTQLLVCSTIRHGDVRETPEDYGFYVTTDPQTILEACQAATVKKPLLIVVTYQSFDKIQAAMLLAKKSRKPVTLGLLVADEAHNTAGENTKKMSLCLSDSVAKIQKRLFLTATPRVAGETVLRPETLNCMNDTSVYGNLVYDLSFAKSIKQGITCDYEIRSMEVKCDSEKAKKLNGKDYQKSEGRITELAKFIAREMKKKPGMRIFSFHTKCENAEAFNQALLKCKVWSRCITGEMKFSDREQILREFESPGESRIITSVRVFAEGVDVPSVDTVMLTDPLTTAGQIAQMVGRGQRVEAGKEKLTVFLPIFHPVGEDGDLAEQTAKCSYFRSALKVLRVMASLDERLVSELRNSNEITGDEDDDPRRIMKFEFSEQFAPVIKSLLLNKVAPFEPKTIEEMVAGFRASEVLRPSPETGTLVLCGKTLSAWRAYLSRHKFEKTLSEVFDMTWPETAEFNPKTVAEMVAGFRASGISRPSQAKDNLSFVLCGRRLDTWSEYLSRHKFEKTLSGVFDMTWPETAEFNPKTVAEMVAGFRESGVSRPSQARDNQSFVLCGKTLTTWGPYLVRHKFGKKLSDVFNMTWPETADWSPETIAEMIAGFRASGISRPSQAKDNLSFVLCGRRLDAWQPYIRLRKFGKTLSEVLDMTWPPNGYWLPSSIDEAVTRLRKDHKRVPSFGEQPCGFAADHWDNIAKSLGITVPELMRRAWPDA